MFGWIGNAFKDKKTLSDLSVEELNSILREQEREFTYENNVATHYAQKIEEMRSYTKKNRDMLSDAQIKHSAGQIRVYSIRKTEAENQSDRLLNHIHSIELVKRLREDLDKTKDSNLRRILSDVDGSKLKGEIDKRQEERGRMDDTVSDIILTLSGGPEPQPPTKWADPEVQKIYEELKRG